MGIQDREYYRRETRGSAWFSGSSPVCKAIILINVACFILAKLIGDDEIERLFSLSSRAVFEKFQIWRLITATFLHDPVWLWHLVGNMLFLWMVGREMEAFLGSREFLWLYLSAAVISSLTWAISDYFVGRGAYAVGASGAVMAVVVLYTLYHPTREVVLFVFPIEMRWLLTIFIGWDLIQFLSGKQTGVAVAGHLGGAAYGYLFKVFDLRLGSLRSRIFRPKPRLRVVSSDAPTREVRSKPRPVSNPSSSSAPTWQPSPAPAPAAPSPRPAPVVVSEEQLNERLDEILAKMTREGPDHITEEEQRILDEASRRARSRRSERF